MVNGIAKLAESSNVDRVSTAIRFNRHKPKRWNHQGGVARKLVVHAVANGSMELRRTRVTGKTCPDSALNRFVNHHARRLHHACRASGLDVVRLPALSDALDELRAQLADTVAEIQRLKTVFP